MDHTFDLNDPERAYNQSGWAHVICSCGTHLSAPTHEELGRMMVQHIEERR